MLKFLILFLTSTLMFANVFDIKFLKGKELMYLLEKNNYTFNYFLNNEDINYLFNKEIKDIKVDNVNDLLNKFIEDSNIYYQINEKDISFFNGNKKKFEKKKVDEVDTKCIVDLKKDFSIWEKHCQLQAIEQFLSEENFIYNLKTINNNHYTMELKIDSETELTSFKDKIKFIYQYRSDVFLKFTINYLDLNKSFKLMISKDNYKSFLNILEESEIKVNTRKFEMEEFLFDTTPLLNNVRDTHKHLDKYEANLIKLYSLYEKINYPYFVQLEGIANVGNQNYYFISNATVENDLPIDRQNKLYVLDNNRFDMKKQKCEITKENKIICYNSNLEISYEGKK